MWGTLKWWRWSTSAGRECIPAMIVLNGLVQWLTGQSTSGSRPAERQGTSVLSACQARASTLESFHQPVRFDEDAMGRANFDFQKQSLVERRTQLCVCLETMLPNQVKKLIIRKVRSSGRLNICQNNHSSRLLFFLCFPRLALVRLFSLTPFRFYFPCSRLLPTDVTSVLTPKCGPFLSNWG